MNTTSEIEKCKNDIVYFVENYTIDTNGNHIKLTDYQKKYLMYLYECSKDIPKINNNLIYIYYRNIYKNKVSDYIRAYRKINEIRT